MRARILLITLALLLSPMPNTQAGSPQTLEDVGAVFGGMYLDANELL